MSTPHIDLVALSPEIIVASTFALVLVIDLFVSATARRLVGVLSFTGCMSAFVVTTIIGASGHRSQMFDGAYTVDSFSLLASSIFLLALSIVFLYGLPQQWKGEYCQLLLASVLGMMSLASSRDLLTFFVSFELFALPGYLLTGWNKKTTKGAEAAVKYYLLGALATALMLYGISFLYGIAGGTNFNEVAASMTNGGDQQALARVSIFLFIVGMAFKVSAVPFHFWTPDAYEGAPVPVAAFLSVASKAAGFIALLEVVNVALPSGRAVWAPIVFALAIGSMVVGNLVALKQRDAVRLLAYSAIAQAGYILIPLAVAHGSGVQEATLTTTFQYLMIYAVANLGAFAVITAIARARHTTALDAFDGLFHSSPAMATALAISLLSLAGIPPLGGWFAKFTVIRDAVSVQSVPSVTIAVIASVTTAVGFVYYLGFLRRMWLDPEPVASDAEAAGTTLATPSIALVLVLTCVSLVVAGVLPGIVTHIGSWSSLHN